MLGAAVVLRNENKIKTSAGKYTAIEEKPQGNLKISAPRPLCLQFTLKISAKNVKYFLDLSLGLVYRPIARQKFGRSLTVILGVGQ